MSDTCIVCLGELGEDISLLHNNNSTLVTTLNAATPNTLPSNSAGPSPPSINDDDDASTPSVLQTITTTTTPQPHTNDDGILEEPGLQIARLLPCGHVLHDDCLKPWVERANSCPICRQTFNQVNVSDKLGGPVISSYSVQDRVQVAEIDPLMLIEDDEDVEPLVCPNCGDNDNEEVLLLCDGCDVPWHTYCVGLDGVPAGTWLCENCAPQQRPEPVAPRAQEARPRQRAARTRETVRNNRMRQSHDSSWSRVWMSVFDRLNIDLDFPFESEFNELPNINARRYVGGPPPRGLERRLLVAQRQGAGNRFREGLEAPAAPATLAARRPRVNIPTPEPESMDEVRAWNAFERARDVEDGSSSSGPARPNRRKRKSPTASPAEPDSTTTEQHHRPLKRPRTRRPQDLIPESHGESSRSARSGGSIQSRLAGTVRNGVANSGASSHSAGTTTTAVTGPSFLQSLLKEVEDSSSTSPGASGSNGVYRPSPFSSTHAGSDHGSAGPSSPRPSSPVLSAVASPSNHSSPRALSASPPPLPLQMTPLTSKVEPIFLAPEYSPSRDGGGSTTTAAAASPPAGAPEDTDTIPNGTGSHASSPQTLKPATLRRGRPSSRPSQPSSSTSTSTSKPKPYPRATDSSPGRQLLSSETKASISQMVSSALKPHYAARTLTKDQYIDINKRISRRMYERVCGTGIGRSMGGKKGKDDAGGTAEVEVDLGDERERARWERVASDEVQVAVELLGASASVR